jgi:hypothetical protein
LLLRSGRWRWVVETPNGSWDVKVPYETQHWTPLTDEEYGPVTGAWDKYCNEVGDGIPLPAGAGDPDGSGQHPATS